MHAAPRVLLLLLVLADHGQPLQHHTNLQDEVKGEHLEAGVGLDAALLSCSLMPITQVARHQGLNGGQVGLDGISTEGGLQQGAQLGVAHRVLDNQQAVAADQHRCGVCE